MLCIYEVCRNMAFEDHFLVTGNLGCPKLLKDMPKPKWTCVINMVGNQRDVTQRSSLTVFGFLP